MAVLAYAPALMRRSLAGSNIGGSPRPRRCHFSRARRDTREIEPIEPDYINDAYERVLASGRALPLRHRSRSVRPVRDHFRFGSPTSTPGQSSGGGHPPPVGCFRSGVDGSPRR